MAASMAVSKNVLVEVIPPSNEMFKIEVEIPLANGKSDIQNMAEIIENRRPHMSLFFKEKNVHFSVESATFPGNYVSVSEFSPIKDRTVVRCTFTDKVQVESSKKGLFVESEESHDILPWQEHENVGGIVSNNVNNNNLSNVNNNIVNLENNSLDTSEDEISENDHIVAPKKRTLPRNQFKLPTMYVPILQKKLEEAQPLSFKDYSSLVRTVACSIRKYTLCPDSDSLLFVIHQLMKKYPSIILNESNPQSTVELLLEKFQKRFSRDRRSVGMQMSKKGGRPRKADTQAQSLPITSAQDIESYKANVKKMVELYQKSNDSAALRVLWKETFEIRRLEFEKGKLSSLEEVRKSCPLFSQPIYIREEMNLIFKKDICQEIQEKWSSMTKAIINLASQDRNANINYLFNIYGEDRSSSTLALELLPLLLRGKKKTREAIKYLIDVRQDPVNIEEAIGNPSRKSPFILKVDEAHHIVVDQKPLLFLTSTEEALVMLVAAYYVFHIKWPEEILPTFLFFQSELVGQRDVAVEKCKVLNIFAKSLRQMLQK